MSTELEKAILAANIDAATMPLRVRIAAQRENAELREALEVVAQTTGHPEVYRLTRSALARKGGSKP